jgi:hypothetical protein
MQPAFLIKADMPTCRKFAVEIFGRIRFALERISTIASDRDFSRGLHPRCIGGGADDISDVR